MTGATAGRRCPSVLSSAVELRLLDLSFNFMLEVDAGAVEAIKCMSNLRFINMTKVGQELDFHLLNRTNVGNDVDSLGFRHRAL